MDHDILILNPQTVREDDDAGRVGRQRELTRRCERADAHLFALHRRLHLS